MTAAISLPGGSLTETQHSTDWCRRVAQDNLVLLSEAGSNLHGIAVNTDDRDIMGVCIEPPEVKLGFTKFSMYEYRSQPKGARSNKGDLDLYVYGMFKWSKLIAGGHPTTLLPLFTPTEKLEYRAWPGEELRANKGMFIARSHGERFIGYLRRQRKHLGGELAPRSNRPELIEQYGFDTKYASHACRIALQGIELMSTGHMTLPMTADNRELLIGMRTGSMSEKEALGFIDELDAQLVAAMNHSPLQPWPRYDDISTLLVGIYHEWWANQRDTSDAGMFSSSRTLQPQSLPASAQTSLIHANTLAAQK